MLGIEDRHLFTEMLAIVTNSVAEREQNGRVRFIEFKLSKCSQKCIASL